MKMEELAQEGTTLPQGLYPNRKVNRSITMFGIWTANFLKNLFL